MKTYVVTQVVDDRGLADLRLPLDHFLREKLDGPDRYGLEQGPFTRWERRLQVEADGAGPGRHRVTTTAEWHLAIPVWRPLFNGLVRRSLRRPPAPGTRDWWMPPLMDARASAVMSIVCVFSLYAGYLGVLLSQTNAFFQREFGASNSEVSDLQIVLRVGTLAAAAVVAVADRKGRRRVLLVSTVLAIVLAATGAIAPDLTAMTWSQGCARVFSSAMALLVAVLAAEEMPAGGRAFGVSVLTLTAGLGAGGVVTLLWVGDLTPSSWRLLFLLPLPFLATMPLLARHLPESRRFEVYELGTAGSPRPAPPHGPGAATAGLPTAEYRRRLAYVSAALFLFYLFTIPQGGFTNNYLLSERGFSGLQITLFQTLTNLPGGLAIVVAGRLADLYGRRRTAVIGVVGGTVGIVGMFNTAGWALWAWSTVAVLLGALTVPSLLVYPTELFPTARRSRVNGITNVVGAAGAVAGLKAVGAMADHFGSFGPGIALVGLAPLALVAIILVFFPETTNRELEELNPADAPPPVGMALARLDEVYEDAHEHGHHPAVHEHDPDHERGGPRCPSGET